MKSYLKHCMDGISSVLKAGSLEQGLARHNSTQYPAN